MSNEDVKAGNGHDGETPTEVATEPQATLPDLEGRIQKAEQERQEAHERMLRVAADFENYKKRVRRETDDATARAKEQLLREILPVVDNFDRALQAVARGGTLESLESGVRLVEKQLHSALEKSGVKGFEAKGEAFDPSRHEAIQQVETDEQAPGTVVDVFARGYTLGERLLRPAMVSVAKAKTAPAPSDSGEAPAAE